MRLKHRITNHAVLHAVTVSMSMTVPAPANSVLQVLFKALSRTGLRRATLVSLDITTGKLERSDAFRVLWGGFLRV